MSKQIDALKLALEALEESHPEAYRHVIKAIKEALAQPEQEPASEDREFWLSVVEGLDKKPESPTQGMTLGQRISHVGGRENANGYIEFGSVMAVKALIEHVLRDTTPPQPKEPEQEPVAWIEHEWSGTGLRHLHFDKREPTLRDEIVNPIWTPLYTTPPQRKPLTDEQIDSIADKFTVRTGDMWEPELCIEFNDSCKSVHSFARAIEAAHGITASEAEDSARSKK